MLNEEGKGEDKYEGNPESQEPMTKILLNQKIIIDQILDPKQVTRAHL